MKLKLDQIFVGGLAQGPFGIRRAELWSRTLCEAEVSLLGTR